MNTKETHKDFFICPGCGERIPNSDKLTGTPQVWHLACALKGMPGEKQTPQECGGMDGECAHCPEGLWCDKQY